MACELLKLCSLLLLAGSGLAGVVVPLAYHQPYAYHAAVPATPTFYSAPVGHPVYYHSAPTAVVAKQAAVVATKTVELAESSPRYDFSYGVHDSLTGDIKNQVETRDGGNVVGSYSVVDADGFKRTVTYTADDVNGFNAVVHREPVHLAKVAVAAPVVSHYVPSVHVQQHQPEYHVQHQPEYHLQQAAVEQAQVSHGAIDEPQPIQYPGEQEQASQEGEQQQQEEQQQLQQQQHQQQQDLQQQQQQQQQELQQLQQQQQQQLQQQQQQQQQQLQQQQQQYPQNQQFPPYPEYEMPVNSSGSQSDNNDSDVVEVRSSNDTNNMAATEQASTTSEAPSTTTAAPAPVNEETNENTTKAN